MAHGPIFKERQSSRSRYRQCIRDHQGDSVEIYTNDLHEALLHKDGPNFWKVWRSKFNTRPKCEQVDGCADNSTIAHKFMEHFSSVCTSVNQAHSQTLKSDYLELRRNYVGTPLTDEYRFDVELIADVIVNLSAAKQQVLITLWLNICNTATPFCRVC